MTIKFSCPECGKSFSVSDESSGRKAKCPCGAKIVVPDATSQLRVSDPPGKAREIMPGQSSHELQFSDSSGHESSLRPAPPQALQDVVYCRKCGTRNDGNAFKCVECGEIVQDVQQTQQARIPFGSVPTYLAHAILATLFCCWPFGIVSIVYAAQVNSRLAVGDYAGAVDMSGKARTWFQLSFGIGLTIVLGYVLIVIIAIASNP